MWTIFEIPSGTMLDKLHTVLLVTVILASAAAGPRERRQLLGPDIDISQLEGLVSNEAFVKIQVKCATAPEALVAAICDRVGNALRKHLPTAMRTLECPGNCSTKELKAIVRSYDIVTAKFPDQWKLLTDHYGYKEPQHAALTKWVDGIRALPDEAPK